MRRQRRIFYWIFLAFQNVQIIQWRIFYINFSEIDYQSIKSLNGKKGKNTDFAEVSFWQKNDFVFNSLDWPKINLLWFWFFFGISSYWFFVFIIFPFLIFHIDTPNINPIKFALGNLTIIYDVIFVLQHYVFYNKSRMSKKMDDTDSFSSTQHLRNADALEAQNI